MADENIVTNIVATADFSNLIADVRKATAALVNLQQTSATLDRTLASNISKVNKSFGDVLRSTGQYSSHFVSLGSDVERFGKNLDGGKLKLRNYFQTWQEYTKTTGGMIRQLAQQQVQLQNSIVQPLGKNAQGIMQYAVHVPRGLDQIKHKTSIARQEMMIYNKVIQDGGVQLINWGKNTQWAGRQLTVGLTVPMAAFGAAAAKAFKEADEQLVRLTKVYGDVSGTSAQELGRVRKEVAATAKELAGSYGAAYKETLGLAADIAATGKTGDELVGSIKETTRLSILGEVDRQEAMKATLAIQSAFKQNTEELADSINFLNAVENQTSTSLADLVEAIPKAGPVVKGLGGSVQDLALYLTAMREGGINASEGANALKSALASLINPTDVAIKRFQGFGIDLKSIVTDNAGNLTQTILALQGALDKLDPLEKQQAIEQLFGKFQFSRLNALFENLGKQGSQTLKVIDLMKSSTGDLENLAARELTAVTESASGKYKRALESVKAELSAVGEQFLRINTGILNFIDGILNFVGKLPDPIKQILAFLGGLTAVAGPLIMLTGVLANFFGYIVKTAYGFKNLFKGGQGWKMLTPEILAANNAASAMETTFYSDAEAANILSVALDNVKKDLIELQALAKGPISVQPTLSTIKGNVVMPGGQRVADPNSPFIGKMGSRDMSHLIPVAMMTPEQRQAQTIFSTVPGTAPVNRKIGAMPQAYMGTDLPKIEGVTAMKGVSTGIVAQEAAKWHAMTAALAVQSQDEIALLKKEIATTGAVTSQLSDAYQKLLPSMTEITGMAAQETELIVRQLQAGKLTVDQAQAEIVALNARVEAMMADTTRQMAALNGRTANLSMVPLLGQPVADPITGKSNMKELFHKGGTKDLVDRIARGLGGVKTSGGGYAIETTKPRRFNAGGRVYDPTMDGPIVPGNTAINYDNTAASVPLGSFVLNQTATRNNPELASMANSGYSGGGKMVPAMLTPGEAVFSPEFTSQNYETLQAANSGQRISFANLGAFIRASRRVRVGANPPRPRDAIRLAGNTGLKVADKTTQNFLAQLDEIQDPVLRQRYITIAEQYASKVTRSAARAERVGGESLYRSRAGKGVIERDKIDYLNRLFRRAGLKPLARPQVSYHDTHWTTRSRGRVSDYTVHYTADSNLRANQGTLRPADLIRNDLRRYPGANKYENQLRAAGIPESMWPAAEQTIDDRIRGFFDSESRRLGVPLDQLPTIGDRPTGGKNAYSFTKNFIPILEGVLREIDPVSVHRSAYKDLKTNKHLRIKRNIGGAVGRVQAATKSMLYRKIGATVSPNAPGGGYGVTSLSLGMGEKLFGKTGLRKNTQNLLYNELAETISATMPYGYYKTKDGKLLKGIDPDATQDMIRDAAHSVLVKHRKQLSPIDIEILKTKFPTWDNLKHTRISRDLEMQLFGTRSKEKYYNAGGPVGGLVKRGKMNYGSTKGSGRGSGTRGSTYTYQSAVDRGTNFRATKGFPVLPANPMAPMLDMIDAASLQVGAGLQLAGRNVASGITNIKDVAMATSMQMAAGVRTAGSNIVNSVNMFRDRVTASAKNMAASANLAMMPHMANFGMGYAEGRMATGPEMRGGYLGFRKKTSQIGTNPDGTPIMGRPGMSMGTQMGIGMVGSMAGMQIAQSNPALGYGLMGASMFAPQIAGGLGKIKDALPAIKTAGAGMSKMQMAGNLLGKAFGLMKFAGPLTALTVGLTAAWFAWKKINKEMEQNRKEATFTNTISKKGAEEAGIKYRNLSDSIKGVREQLELNSAKAKAAFENFNSAGVTGVSYTIAEMKKAKAEAKKNMKETVDIFTNIDEPTQAGKQEKVLEIATNLKAQYMAAGMSAQEATNKIYAVISASDKAGMAFKAIQNQGFQAVSSQETAMDTLLKGFEKVSQLVTWDSGYSAVVANISGEDLGLMIDNATNSLDIFVSNLMTTKDASGNVKTEFEAIQMAMDKIAESSSANTVLTQAQIESLKKTHPELASIIRDGDTLGGIYAKWRLHLQGVNADFKNITSEQSAALLAFTLSADKAFDTMAKSGDGTLGKTAKIIKTYDAQIKAGGKDAQKAAQRSQEQIKKEIELINERIKKINEEADARKKAISDQQKAADFQLDIQQAQLEYTDAMARGDTAAAAQAQIKIQQLTNEFQAQKALDAIEADRAARTKVEEARIKKLQDEADAAEKVLQGKQNAAADAAARKEVVSGFDTRYRDLMQQQMLANQMAPGKERDDKINEIRGALQNLASDIGKAVTGKDKTLSKDLIAAFSDLVTKTGASKVGKVETYTVPPALAGGKPVTGSKYVPGEGDKAFNKDVNDANKLAEANFKELGDTITKGYSLKDVYNIIKGQDKKAPSTAYKTEASALKVTGDYKNNLEEKTDDKGNKIQTLDGDAKKAIIAREGLQDGQIFKYTTPDGYTSWYKVKGTGATRQKSEKVGMAAGGHLKLATAGYVSGPGTGTSDSIHAMLSDGEFVIKAAAVKKYGPGLFDAYNNMRIPVEGKAMGGVVMGQKYNVPRMNMGGYMNLANAGPVGGSNALYNINVTLEGSGLDANDVARAISREMQLRESRNGLSRNIGG